jgi:HD-GYP domain-containing protein (c-di-GMP phosphodiesterase class II)
MMPVKTIEDLAEGQITEADYYSANGQLLIGKGETLSARHLSLLRHRNIYEVHFTLDSPKPPEPAKPAGTGSLTAIPPETNISSPVPEHLLMAVPGATNDDEAYEKLSSGRLFESLDRGMRLERVIDSPVGRSFGSSMHQQFLVHRPAIYKSEIAHTYEDAIQSVGNILTRLTGGSRVDTGSIRALIERFLTPFISDRNIILSIATRKVSNRDGLYYHALNVALLSMNLAASAGFSEEQVVQVGIGALLHDVGMLLVPEGIRFKEGRLTDAEWFEVRKHPLYGIHIIDRLTRLPDAVKYITYQTHERENGKGYPKQRPGHLIHNFAKIVQIADIFDAVASPRPYRVAYTPFKGVEMLIKLGKQKLISEQLVTTMLKSVSLFPVGSLVELSDGRIGQVIASNEYHLAHPLISIVAERDRVLLPQSSTYLTDLSKEPDIQVVRSYPFGTFGCDALYGF